MQRTPAQLYALLIGAVLVGAGILGSFYNTCVLIALARLLAGAASPTTAGPEPRRA